MKALYVIDQNVEEGKTSGIIYKVHNKILYWKKQEIDIQLLSLYSFKLYDSNLNVINDKYSFSIARHGRWFTLIRMIYSTYLLKKFLSDFNYDLMYIRQRPYFPFTKSCFKRVKTIIELNTDDVGEYKATSLIFYIINNLTRKFFYNNARGFVSVSSELSKKYSKEFKKKTLTIANGINVSEYPINKSKNNNASIIFVGSPGFPWHGLDKIEYLAKECKEFDFHIVGISSENKRNIFFHGYCSLEKTISLINQSDVGICSLSLYVNNMNVASPLKSRQYLAQGTPIIYAYDDDDLNGNEEFALKIDNDKDNVKRSLEDIKAFINKAKSNLELRKLARSHAEKYMDINIKETKRIEFLKNL